MSLKPLTRSLLTLATVAVAIVLVAALWHAYVLAPWTRDARVSAHVVRIAPEVSGTVVEVAVIDNQRVAKGDVLYRIDPQRFALAVEQAEAQVAATAETMRQKRDEAQRRTGLDDLVPREDIQRSGRAVAIAQAEHRKALAALDVAKLDLERTTLRSPVDGYVTQLRLRHGDYAVEGKPGISVLDAHSFWITGYFEETKLRRIATDAPATIRLMGFDSLLSGHVTSIGRGIADENGTLDELGLPAVNPTFSWVRLAQRIPVRIEIDRVPAGVLLAAGMTCSVEVGERGRERTPRGRLASWLHAWL
ncbi:biotin/lipoyl-binding protein [Burkholderia aenigmatica]|uniref:Efflux transporter periplasmic adaptor subunit n=1 Tax=Burkholderia aenigmatica TaxID=2015348 RepID=A0A228HTZ9_9BURK|nr:HlyD family secretion protein [Burkholderia aenigmatica]MDN7875213.1 HlyD family secretion protein [Burkholderia aenigmatica]OXI33661.1 efflux transporter periplasmic adaptor subunit [Burkholderia aenigmatica]